MRGIRASAVGIAIAAVSRASSASLPAQRGYRVKTSGVRVQQQERVWRYGPGRRPGMVAGVPRLGAGASVG
jgi:hypothetical protein